METMLFKVEEQVLVIEQNDAGTRVMGSRLRKSEKSVFLPVRSCALRTVFMPRQAYAPGL